MNPSIRNKSGKIVSRRMMSGLILSGLLTGAPALQAQEDYQLQQSYQPQEDYLDVVQEFEQYQEDTEAEFRAFEEAMESAYQDFLGDIEKEWGDTRFTDQYQWVQYSGDLKQRTIVDYQNDSVVIEYMDVDSKEVTYQDVTQQLNKTLQTNIQTAIDSDPVLQAASRASGLVIEVEADTAVEAMLPSSSVSKSTNSMAVAEELVDSEGVSTSYLPVSRRLTVVIKLPEEFGMHKAERYWKATAEYAKAWKLEPALVMAIIHTESSFNPMARSRIPAYGLMQIVPRTAGRDAARMIFGKSKMLKPKYLFDPNNNIQVGAAYLHVLNHRYLKGIYNPESRLYCTIAAYNTGTANVAAAFIDQKSMQKAYDRINQLEPSEVYDILATRLPYRETRDYLKKVVGRYQLYIN
ncbi:murein transglycosylase domain-containing protein [Litoribrevibacter albus]|uniref:Membrane-bound lytic murein transglycosylase C n=1 Tax=Litoribrevibacter albus TaxID=1473156 RepID=A0AA37S8P8_9GAMM|nr:murein transglycosylase domain-containing protein [Litoribrevibacter albus]GLQ31252.1 membrane-bound lytic murein transglycosylase C [Litoribrevibacter albus]